MCDSLAEGGLRCASGARPAFDAAKYGTPEWDDAAAVYASTAGGNAELSAIHATYKAMYDADPTGALPSVVQRVAALEAALERGRSIRQAAMHTKAVMKGQPLESIGSYPDWYPSPAGGKPIEAGEWMGDPAWVKAWNGTPVEQRAPLRLFHANKTASFGYSTMVHLGPMAAVADRARDMAEKELGLYGAEARESHDKVAKKAARMMHLHEVHWTGNLIDVPLDDGGANAVDSPEKFTNAETRSIAEQVAQGSSPIPTMKTYVQFWGPSSDDPEGAPAWLAGDTAVTYWNSIEGRGLPSVVLNKDAGGWKLAKTRKLKAADIDVATTYKKGPSMM